MENFIISVPDSEKDFFISLIGKLNFAKIKSVYTEKEKTEYINALSQAETDVNEGKVIYHADLKKDISEWK